jgi:hypothetical protein
MLKGSLHPKWRSAPSLPVNSRKVSKEELTHTGHSLCLRPCKEVRGRSTDEMGEVPS